MTLAQWIKETGRTQKWVAEQIGVGVARVSRIVNGHADTVSPRVAAAIYELTNGNVSIEEAIFPNGVPEGAPGKRHNEVAV